MLRVCNFECPCSAYLSDVKLGGVLVRMLNRFDSAVSPTLCQIIAQAFGYDAAYASSCPYYACNYLHSSASVTAIMSAESTKCILPCCLCWPLLRSVLYHVSDLVLKRLH